MVIDYMYGAGKITGVVQKQEGFLKKFEEVKVEIMLSKVDRYQPKIHLVASGISRVVDSQRRVEYTFKFKWHTYTK